MSQKLQETHSDGTLVVEAILNAWDEMERRETRQQRDLRTYGWRNLTNDLKSHISTHEGINSDSFWPITEWGQANVPAAIVDKLREAAPLIGRMATERTISGGRLGIMSSKELYEFALMEQAAEFLRTQGLRVDVSREWEDPNAPLDYRGTIEEIPWVFELTQLRDYPEEGYFRKIGHPKERKSLNEQLEGLEMSLPEEPNGPDALQSNLNRAIEHGRKECKTKTLDGARYCLVIHNEQFTNPEDWERITWPQLGDFAAVMILHDQPIPPARVWQVIPLDGLGRTLESGTVEDVERMAFVRHTESTQR